MGVAYMGRCVLRCLKQELAWGTDKWLQVIKNKMLLKYCYTTKKVKKKAILSSNNIVCTAMWSLVMYSNCLVIYYQLMLHGSTIKVCF